MRSSHRLGKWAEDHAVNYLQDKGYVILERNFRYDRAEIDIIAEYGNLIVIVEVKARSTDYFGHPQDFISRKKVARLVKAANYYMTANDFYNEVRFDAIGILKGENGVQVEHLEDAFYFF
ncbi:YraN family protein [Robertkochia flava]|uniref:YraN family protein n=1 Tax=Robertkochia flava TaxID=3447986 RepID=UPI001CCB2F6D|nr:YraN family protein [Robertkochia marina]